MPPIADDNGKFGVVDTVHLDESAHPDAFPTPMIAISRYALVEELAKIRVTVGEAQYAKARYAEAAALFDRITTEDRFVDFLTLPGYEQLD